jgi:putative methylase
MEFSYKLKQENMIKKKKQLEMALEGLPSHPHPNPDLEQYSTPASIAADLVWNAHAWGDVEGLKIVDLGCGTGILSLATILMGASQVVGVDLDPESIKLAHDRATEMKLNNIQYVEGDALNFRDRADTVIMNPPFGAQKAMRREADRRFLEKALELAPVSYSFHLKKTEKFLNQIIFSLDAKITTRLYYTFPIPKIYQFHQEEQKMVEVIVIRVVKDLDI